MTPEGIAVVTGASRGLGRATALELARRGFEVTATMRRPEAAADLPAEAARQNGRLRVQRLDVTDPDSIDLPDGLVVLVNNAAIEGAYLPVENAPMGMWREIFETNVFGVIEVTRRAIPKLRASGGGVICNITSCSVLVPMPLFAAYRASKAAVGAIGDSLRVELASFGIRLVEIMPGAIQTDLLVGSERMPEAAQCAGYRELAERVYASRLAAGSQVTPVAEAAASVVDSILEDHGPLRRSCDSMGAGLLSSWRAGDDEELAKVMLGLLAPPGG